jgi:aldose 1-epimerase
MWRTATADTVQNSIARACTARFYNIKGDCNMSITKSLFGHLADGTQVDLYTITNKSGASVTLQTLGAGIQALNMPDKNGELADVVLGFDNPVDYVNPDYGYQGLVVGRWANRIRDAKFTFNGVEYNTPANQGTWTLHGGGRFSFTNWEVEQTGDDFITFKKFSPDMEDGFGGNFTMWVTYTLTQSNTLRIEYKILSDKDTVANPTNHAYFNLSGDNSKTIENHYLQIFADYFTETDASQLPTGELGKVEGTMMDFTQSHKIGDKIDEPFRAIIDGIGYDNNYCLRNKEIGKLELAAILEDKDSGRKMQVFTDLPGIQLYCGGWLSKDYTAGKGDNIVKFRRGVALETQFYPDTVNHANFPSKYVKANEEFKTVTEFRFTVE